MEDTPSPPKFLPDDVLLEVLGRVAVKDVAALFRCAAACKRWCYLITDPSFLCLRWPEGASHTSDLVGFFTQQRCKAGDQNDDRDGAGPCAPPVFDPTAGSVFGSGRRSLTSFVRGTVAGLLDGAKPVVARGGFLLVRLAPVTCVSDSILLAACNVLIGTCDVLPPLEKRSSAFTRYVYAILTGEDCDASNNSTRFFKVLAMGLVNNFKDPETEKLQCDLHTLTADEPSWTTHTECFPGAIDLCWRHWNDAVVCDGVVSWLYASMPYNDDIGYLQFSTIDVSAKNGRLTLTKLSFPPPMILPITGCYRLAAVGGTVSLLCYYIKQGEKHFCQETWKQGDDVGGDRPCSRATKLTGSGDEAAGPLSPMAMDDVPMEIDWPALLISRLARYAEVIPASGTSIS